MWHGWWSRGPYPMQNFITLRTFDSGKSSHSVGLVMWQGMVLELISVAVSVDAVTIALITLLLCTHSNAIYQETWRLYSRGWHGNGNPGSNRGDGDKSREQSGNNAVMSFRIIGNTAGIKLINATDMATGDALLIKQHEAVVKLQTETRHLRAWDAAESQTRLYNCWHLTTWHLSTTECGKWLYYMAHREMGALNCAWRNAVYRTFEMLMLMNIAFGLWNGRVLEERRTQLKGDSFDNLMFLHGRERQWVQYNIYRQNVFHFILAQANSACHPFGVDKWVAKLFIRRVPPRFGGAIWWMLAR